MPVEADISVIPHKSCDCCTDPMFADNDQNGDILSFSVPPSQNICMRNFERLRHDQKPLWFTAAVNFVKHAKSRAHTNFSTYLQIAFHISFTNLINEKRSQMAEIH